METRRVSEVEALSRLAFTASFIRFRLVPRLRVGFPFNILATIQITPGSLSAITINDPASIPMTPPTGTPTRQQAYEPVTINPAHRLFAGCN